jgi:hypothetical protein
MNSVTTRLSRASRRGYQDRMPIARSGPLFALFLGACGDAGGSTASTTSGPTGSSTGAQEPGTGTEPTPTTGAASTDTDDGELAGLELLPRLAGLWSGPVTMTPLGTFSLMNVDIRAASGAVLFGRVDLDEANSLRFAFEVEAPGSEPTLVYRNGGYFLGLLRDSRTKLIEHDAAAGSWRFCSTGPQGCDYIDARWNFKDADALIFDVKVKGQQHVYWDATRKDTRALPEPFPADLTPQADDAPFPPMPTLKIDVGWAGELAVDGAVWVILSTMDCDLQFTCTHSRSLTKGAAAGSTAQTLTIDQIHPGAYKLNVILDRNGNLADTLYPDKGDGIGGINQAVTVAPSGETTVKATIGFTL